MKKLQNNPVTEEYLDEKLNDFKGELKDELKEELKEELGGDLKNELYLIKDEIVGEIKAMREEFDTHQFSHARIEETLENHGKRLVIVGK